ncbi:MAG: glycosyltransferase family 2 protein [Actinobacteria bacterium]|nr:MAG: glycosyltransferase family 2 protein [Actinomycetota bacterium]
MLHAERPYLTSHRGDVVILPVYNEAPTVGSVIEAVRQVFDGVIIVVDDGSTDDTKEILGARHDIVSVCHMENRGYGRSLADGFDMARAVGAERVVTMDCDGQHEPAHIPAFLDALADADIVSGSRYLDERGAVGIAPEERRAVNARVTAAINELTRWGITDAFCGFKAYRASALDRMRLTESGYALPLELWARAWQAGLSVIELPVERIYFDGDRSFGEDLDDPERRLAYYMRVWHHALSREV